MADALSTIPFTLDDGRVVDVRPIRPDDVEAERAFILALSPRARRYRFLEHMNEPSEALLDHLTHVDHLNDEALVAIARAGEDAGKFVGVVRYAVGNDPAVGEIAMSVAEAWRGGGLQRALLGMLAEKARERGLTGFVSVNSSDDHDMREFARNAGFTASPDPDDHTQTLYSLAL